MGAEISQGFNLSDFELEDQENLTGEGPHLKDDVTFVNVDYGHNVH
jgi:hypothetical protein